VCRLWFAGAPLLRLAYGTEFSAANTIFRLLVIEASLGALSQVTAQLYLSHNRPGFVSTIQVCVLGATLAALLLLVPAYGAKKAQPLHFSPPAPCAGSVCWGE